MTDEQIKQMWVDAWLEQNTGVEPDEEEVKALKSFLSKVKQHYEPSIKAQALQVKIAKEQGRQEVLQKRLDRPDRGEIRGIIFNAISHFNKGDDEQLYGAIKQILALIPDIEELKEELRVGNKLTAALTDKCREFELQIKEAKKQERERWAKMLGEALKEQDNELRGAVEYIWQALKEEKEESK